MLYFAEAFENTAVALRVVEGDEKCDPVPGGIIGPTSHWGTEIQGSDLPSWGRGVGR
jgi:hypothetical protein